jgi:hypothetical protein
MRARDGSQLAGSTAQRYSSFANKPFLKATGAAVKGVPILAVASAGVTFSQNMASGDSAGRAATRTVFSTGLGLAAGVGVSMGVSWAAGALAIGVAGGPVGLAVAGLAIGGSIFVGWLAQQGGDKIGATVHDEVLAPAGRAIKGAWNRLFG